MKDQYFGDINDYRKYGLLRVILAAKLRLGVCWMLTAPDRRTDGSRLAYLDNPGRFQAYDPDLFTWLQQTMRAYPDRHVSRIESSGLLSNAVYFADVVGDCNSHRTEWFARCLRKLAGCELIFFDPDNGLERSVPLGRRHSHKFLYWTEVRQTFRAGASILIYQHFPRESRVEYIQRLAWRLQTETGAATVFSFTTPHVVFLLAAHEHHSPSLRIAIQQLPSRWPAKEIATQEFITSDTTSGAVEEGLAQLDAGRGIPFETLRLEYSRRRPERHQP